MKPFLTVDEWVARFRAIGLDDAVMEQWHRLFERKNPEQQRFLEWQDLSAGQVAQIREFY